MRLAGCRDQHLAQQGNALFQSPIDQGVKYLQCCDTEMPGKLVLGQKTLSPWNLVKHFKVCRTEEKTKCFPGIWMEWRVCQGPECTLPLRGFWLAASDQLAGQSWWGKKSWEKFLWRIPCEALLRHFHGRRPLITLGAAWSHSSLMLGSCLSCIMAVCVPARLAPSWWEPWPCHGLSVSRLSLRFASSLGCCCSLLWFHCACQAGLGHLSSNGAENDGWFLLCCRIESAGIIEDDIPSSLGIQTQPLPAREQLLPKLWTHTTASTSSKTQKGLGSRTCAADKDNWANGESTGMIFHNNHRESEKYHYNL